MYGNNKEYSVVGQHPYDPDHVILQEIMKDNGYTTGMFGMYKKLTREFTGTFTGKGLEFGGSLIRPEATGFGARDLPNRITVGPELCVRFFRGCIVFRLFIRVRWQCIGSVSYTHLTAVETVRTTISEE